MLWKPCLDLITYFIFIFFLSERNGFSISVLIIFEILLMGAFLTMNASDSLLQTRNIDHYITASKYRKYDNQDEFSSYEKTIKIDQNKKIIPDNDFAEKLSQNIYDSLYAKFSQNPDLLKTLYATKDATLYYRINKQKKVLFTELMYLRDYLKEYVEKTLKPFDTHTTSVPTLQHVNMCGNSGQHVSS